MQHFTQHTCQRALQYDLFCICRHGASQACHVCLDKPAACPADTDRHAVPEQAGLNVVINTGDTTVLLSDALRRPLLEVELGKINAGMAQLPTSVLQAHLDVQISIWSFNAVNASWEPVMEPWGLLTKLELNRSPKACPETWNLSSWHKLWTCTRAAAS